MVRRDLWHVASPVKLKEFFISNQEIIRVVERPCLLIVIICNKVTYFFIKRRLNYAIMFITYMAIVMMVMSMMVMPVTIPAVPAVASVSTISTVSAVSAISAISTIS